jgi:desulfoferrodoxin (superoxide reductase-like protein)
MIYGQAGKYEIGFPPIPGRWKPDILLFGGETQGGKKMTRRNFFLSCAGTLVLLLFSRKFSWANKAGAKIELPAGAGKGKEFLIRVTVIHNANNFFHHIEWLWVKFDDQEIARWEFNSSNRPEGETFTREIKYRAEREGEIRAKANCNLHGSLGEAVVRI